MGEDELHEGRIVVLQALGYPSRRAKIVVERASHLLEFRYDLNRACAATDQAYPLACKVDGRVPERSVNDLALERLELINLPRDAERA